MYYSLYPKLYMYNRTIVNLGQYLKILIYPPFYLVRQISYLDINSFNVQLHPNLSNF